MGFYTALGIGHSLGRYFSFLFYSFFFFFSFFSTLVSLSPCHQASPSFVFLRVHSCAYCYMYLDTDFSSTTLVFLAGARMGGEISNQYPTYHHYYCMFISCVMFRCLSLLVTLSLGVTLCVSMHINIKKS